MKAISAVDQTFLIVFGSGVCVGEQKSILSPQRCFLLLSQLHLTPTFLDPRQKAHLVQVQQSSFINLPLFLKNNLNSQILHGNCGDLILQFNALMSLRSQEAPLKRNRICEASFSNVPDYEEGQTGLRDECTSPKKVNAMTFHTRVIFEMAVLSDDF